MSTGTEAGLSRYWEERAVRYGRSGSGLRAVCSYGMPGFYNQFIDVCQWLALRRWLARASGRDVLDLGCGVGRWSFRIAARARSITGVDLSPSMVAEARQRADRRGLGGKCRFQVADAGCLRLNREFGFILGVTVLQHILEEERLDAAIQGIVRHLAGDGWLVLLEAAPNRPVTRCDTPVFKARSVGAYSAAFARAGLGLVAVGGVDPAPFKTLLLPHYKNLPGVIRIPALAAATGASLLVDLPAGRRWISRSWHKVFVLRGAELGSRSAREEDRPSVSSIACTGSPSHGPGRTV